MNDVNEPGVSQWAGDPRVVGRFGFPENGTDERAKTDKSPPAEEEVASGPFPTDLLPPVLRDVVREAARLTDTPQALPAVVALGLVSASLGAGLLVQSGPGRVTPPNLFLLGVARSGTGKGRVFSMLGEPFFAAEREVLERWREHEKPHIEAELRIAVKRAEAAERDAVKETDRDARRMLTLELQNLEAQRAELERQRDASPHYSVGDVTREMLAVIMAGQPGEALATLSAEARGVIAVMLGKYSSGKSSDEDIYLSGYSGDAVKVDRLSRAPVMLSAPRLSLLWLIQPDIARKLTEDERMTDGGLLPRMLMCDVKAECRDEPEHAERMSQTVAAAWDKLVRTLLREYREMGDLPRTIPSASGAREVLRRYTNESRRAAAPGGPLEDVQSYVVRWGENAWRLALCLHAAVHGEAAGSQPLVADTARAAVGIARWFSTEQMNLLAVSRSRRVRTRLERLLELVRQTGDQVTVRDLHRCHGYPKEEVANLVERFPARLEMLRVASRGRPSMVVRARK